MARGNRRNSGPAATTPAADPGHRPMVLVMLAIFSLSPAAPVRAGKLMNVPPPAIELTAPATNAAMAMISRVMGGRKIAEGERSEKRGDGRERSEKRVARNEKRGHEVASFCAGAL